MYDELGRPIEATIIADNLLNKAKKKDLWETVSLIVGVYFKKHPEFHEKHKRYLSKMRNVQKNKFGASENARGEIKGFRYLGDIPVEISNAFDLLLYERIKSKGKKEFYREFFKKYPVFRVAEKV